MVRSKIMLGARVAARQPANLDRMISSWSVAQFLAGSTAKAPNRLVGSASFTIEYPSARNMAASELFPAPVGPEIHTIMQALMSM